MNLSHEHSVGLGKRKRDGILFSKIESVPHLQQTVQLVYVGAESRGRHTDLTSPGHKSQYLQISVLSVWGVMTDVLYSALLAAVHCSQLSQAATSQLETE